MSTISIIKLTLQLEKAVVSGSMPLATYSLIAVNVAISLLAFQEFRKNSGANFVFSPYHFMKGENVTGMILSNFSHGDMFHLFFNVYTLYSFGVHLEIVGGMAVFLVVYLVSMIVSIVAVLLFKRKEADYRCLGASGAVVGVIFASIVYAPAGQVLLFGVVPLSKVLYAILFVGLSIVMAKKAPMGIAHEAHIGGAIGGFVTAAILAPFGLQPLIETVQASLGLF